MPRRCDTDPALASFLRFQDNVISRDQVLARGVSAESVRYRLRSGQWHKLLPQVYLTHPGDPSRRQMLVAALLYAGPLAAIDGVDACRFAGIRGTAIDLDKVHVVVPWGDPCRSYGFVVVRRTISPISMVSTDLLRYVGPAQAAIAATRRAATPRQVLAVLSDALQRSVVTYEELVAAHLQGPSRRARWADDALEDLGAGTRSLPEADFRRLVNASPVLADVTYNVWLRLVTGRVVCVDALIASSGVVHETNGRVAHAREDLFQDMQDRHDALTASGLIVLHNAPRRIRLRSREVIAEVERCHQLYAGRGMPDGVSVLAMAS